jgi:cytochrome c oxidase subunit 2
MNPQPQLPLYPESASTLAPHVDALFATWSLVSIFFSVLIAFLIIYFMVRYRRRSEDEVGQPERAAVWLEIAWSVIPLGISLFMFAWGARVFYDIYRAPADAVDYYGVGKQWMWKFQHPDGHREINALHVPTGQAIRMKLTSEDVIHSFYVPAFRIKQDAIPGRYTSIWFKATKPGVYHLFCAEYCGTEHSRMIGSVVVMEPREYAAWLAGGPAGKTVTASGADLFQQLACQTCHRPSSGMEARAPRLEGLFGHQVKLADGRTLTADESYIRESILNPTAKVVAGWTPIMPTFQGQISEEQLTQLISYVKSLANEGGAEAGGGTPSAVGAGAAAAQQAPQATQSAAQSAPKPESQKP